MPELNVEFIDKAHKFVRISIGDNHMPIEQLTKTQVAELIAKLTELHAQMVDV